MSLGGSTVLDQNLDLGGFRVFNPGAPSLPTDVVRLQDIPAAADPLGWYVVTKAADAPANATNLGGLPSGFVKSTQVAGVATISIDTSTYLTTGAAASTYLTQATAASTYETIAAAASTYQVALTPADGTISFPTAGTIKVNHLSNAFIASGTADAQLTGAFFLGSLSSGILKVATGTGALATAATNVDYADPTAFYVVTKSASAPSNSTNLGGLTAGVLQQTVSGSAATLAALNVGTSRIPFGASGSTGLLTTDSRFEFSTASASNVFMRIADTTSFGGASYGGVNLQGRAATGRFGFNVSTVLNPNAGAQPVLELSNDNGEDGQYLSIYLTSTIYSGAFPANSVFFEASGSAGQPPGQMYFARNDYGGGAGGAFVHTLIQPDGGWFWANLATGAAVSPSGWAGIRTNSNQLQFSENGGAWVHFQRGLTSTSGANLTSKFILQTADAGAPNAQVLSVLSTGIAKVTTTTGVISTAVSNTDFADPGAYYVVTRSANAPANATNLGGLSSGMLSISVSGAVAAFASTAAVSGAIAYGAASGGVLAYDANDLFFDATAKTLWLTKTGSSNTGAPLRISGIETSDHSSILLDFAGNQAITKAGGSGNFVIQNNNGALSFSTSGPSLVIDPATNEYAFSALAIDGFVKTTGGAGILSVDTTVYLSQAYTTVLANGTAQTARAKLNFSTAFTAVDNAGALRTDIGLSATGVGSVSVTNANLTIGVDGRIITASNGSSGGTGADALGTYLVASSSHAPANGINLGGLSSGLVRSTVTGGVAAISIDTNAYLVTAYANVQQAGSAVTQRSVLNFTAQFSASDVSGKTQIDLATVGSAGTVTNATITRDVYGRVVSFAPGATPADGLGHYVVLQSADAPANATNLGALGSGFVKSTVSGAVSTLSIDTTTYQPALSLTSTDVLFATGSSTVGQDGTFNFNSTTHTLSVSTVKVTGNNGDSIGGALLFTGSFDQAIEKSGGALWVGTSDNHFFQVVTNDTSRLSVGGNGIWEFSNVAPTFASAASVTVDAVRWDNSTVLFTGSTTITSGANWMIIKQPTFNNAGASPIAISGPVATLKIEGAPIPGVSGGGITMGGNSQRYGLWITDPTAIGAGNLRVDNNIYTQGIGGIGSGPLALAAAGLLSIESSGGVLLQATGGNGIEWGLHDVGSKTVSLAATNGPDGLSLGTIRTYMRVYVDGQTGWVPVLA